MAQTCFRQVDVPLDTAQDFIINDALVAQLQNDFPFHFKCVARKLFVLRGEKAVSGFALFSSGDFRLADTVRRIPRATVAGLLHCLICPLITY